MKKDKITYAAILSNGRYIEKDSFNELKPLSNKIIFILKIAHYKEYVTGPGRKVNYYSFKPVDFDENYTIVDFDEYQIIDIGPEEGSYYDYGILFKILDKKRDLIHDFKSTKNGLSVFENELFPLMAKLNDAGSWENYCNGLKVVEQENRIANLLKENQELTKRIEELELESKISKKAKSK